MLSVHATSSGMMTARTNSFGRVTARTDSDISDEPAGRARKTWAALASARKADQARLLAAANAASSARRQDITTRTDDCISDEAAGRARAKLAAASQARRTAEARAIAVANVKMRQRLSAVRAAALEGAHTLRWSRAIDARDAQHQLAALAPSEATAAAPAPARARGGSRHTRHLDAQEETCDVAESTALRVVAALPQDPRRSQAKLRLGQISAADDDDDAAGELDWRANARVEHAATAVAAHRDEAREARAARKREAKAVLQRLVDGPMSLHSECQTRAEATPPSPTVTPRRVQRRRKRLPSARAMSTAPDFARLAHRLGRRVSEARKAKLRVRV